MRCPAAAKSLGGYGCAPRAWRSRTPKTIPRAVHPFGALGGYGSGGWNSPRTRWLADTEPPWGADWGGELADFVQMSWTEWQHALVHLLGQHSARTDERSAAAFCVVAEELPTADSCAEVKTWAALCPGKPIAAISHSPDPDQGRVRLCRELWDSCAEAERGSSVVRVVANVPRLRRYRWCHRKANPDGCAAHCGLRVGSTPTIDVPYFGHARRVRRALFDADVNRSTRVAMVASSYGHGQANNIGTAAWRRLLGGECYRTRKYARADVCSYGWPQMLGGNAKGAVVQYAKAVFCLQPPGDTMPRSGIVDAVSVGCIPVLFHPAQLDLWRWCCCCGGGGEVLWLWVGLWWLWWRLHGPCFLLFPCS